MEPLGDDEKKNQISLQSPHTKKPKNKYINTFLFSFCLVNLLMVPVICCVLGGT